MRGGGRDVAGVDSHLVVEGGGPVGGGGDGRRPDAGILEMGVRDTRQVILGAVRGCWESGCRLSWTHGWEGRLLLRPATPAVFSFRRALRQCW